MKGRYKKRGWYGDSHGHSLAAKGISLYAKKQRIVDPMFFSRQESQLSTVDIRDMVRKGMMFDEILANNEGVSRKELQKRGVIALDSIEGNEVMSTIYHNGENDLVELLAQERKYGVASRDDSMNARIRAALNDPQKASFISEDKVKILKEYF